MTLEAADDDDDDDGGGLGEASIGGRDALMRVDGRRGDDADARVAEEEDGTTPLLPTEDEESGATEARRRSEARASARESFEEHGRTLCAFAGTLVVTTMSMSVPFPFLAQEFAAAGVAPGEVGLVFAALPLGTLLVSPIAPKLTWRWKATSVAKWSLFGQAMSVFATTLGGRSRYDIWLVTRLTQGFFNAVTSVTMLCVVTRAIPEAVSLCSGIQEVAAGFGTMIGPVFGGCFYDVQKSPKLPLVANGIAILASIPPVMYAMRGLDDVRDGNGPGSTEDDDMKPSYVRILRHPTFLATVLAELVISSSFGGIPTTLPLYLHRSFNFKPSMIGVVYSLLAGLYALTTPLVGVISHRDSKLTDILLCLFGMGSIAVAHLLFGPSSFLRLATLSESMRRRVCVWGASVIYGIGSSFAFVPLLPLMARSIRNEGRKYVDLANGMFVSCYFFGEMLGQLFGSSLVHALGYPRASTAWALAIVASASGLVSVQFGAAMARHVKRVRNAMSRTGQTLESALL